MNKKHRKYIHRKIYRQRFGYPQPTQAVKMKQMAWIYKQFIKTYIELGPLSWLSKELIDVEPMDGPTGTVFHLNIKND